MTPFHVTAPTHRLAPTLAGRIARAGRRAWHTYWDWRARQATVEILRALDNRTLHDIGLSRSEIEFGGPRCAQRAQALLRGRLALARRGIKSGIFPGKWPGAVPIPAAIGN